MTSCPSCGADLSDARKLAKRSAAELVESLRLDEKMLTWCHFHAPRLSVEDAASELEAFKDRMRANGYKTNAGPVRDAHAAFRTHLRNAVRFAPKQTAPAAAQRTVRPAKKEE